MILSDKWMNYLGAQLTDYQIVSIILNDGTVHDQVAISGATIRGIYNFVGIPFNESDIKDIIITHKS